MNEKKSDAPVRLNLTFKTGEINFYTCSIKYLEGDMNLAFEMCIGTDPSIAYLMEDNDAVTQALVLAHACCGHNHVFKNNYIFKEAALSKTIIDYLIYAREYIKECEEKYGAEEVEQLLDIGHALSNNSLDRRHRKYRKALSEKEQSTKDAVTFSEDQENLDLIIKTTSAASDTGSQHKDPQLAYEEDNLLYFIANNSVVLKEWQREILTIVQIMSQSLYPNRLTKLLHEGFATFVHVYIMNELEKKGIISPDAQISWMHTHSSVVFQPDMHSKYYDGSINPYALGLDMFKDIRRICENPTDEDRAWFPDLVDKPWREEIKNAVANYNDESFILQYLSPTLIRKYKIMTVSTVPNSTFGIVTEIADDVGYRNIRSKLAEKYNLINYIPSIVIKPSDMKHDRSLHLEYSRYNERPLYPKYANTLVHMIKDVWGYDVTVCDSISLDTIATTAKAQDDEQDDG